MSKSKAAKQSAHTGMPVWRTGFEMNALSIRPRSPFRFFFSLPAGDA